MSFVRWGIKRDGRGFAYLELRRKKGGGAFWNSSIKRVAGEKAQEKSEKRGTSTSP